MIMQWSIKKLLKELVMSATYRQDSKLTEELKEKDAANKFYARGPRVRLSAEQLRDQHLCISGEHELKNVWSRCNAVAAGGYLVIAI